MRAVSYLLVAGATAAATYGMTHIWQQMSAAPPVALPAPAAPGTTPEAAAPPAAPLVPLDELDVSPQEQINIRVYQEANRGVVHITTRSVHLDDFFLLTGPREGSGSGCVLDDKGHILTNYHVVEDSRQIIVTLFDGNTYQARLIGSDPNNDLAVLHIDAPADKLHPLRWGDSSRLLVGMYVYAIGNPFGLDRTLTTGIISSLNRSLRTDNNRMIRGVIQTDAAINPGNSGGPLLNAKGEIIGVTTAIVGRAEQSSGIGLAVPANTARRVIEELIRFGRIIRPDCGIFSVIEVEEGLLIARLTPDGPAERAGLRGPEMRLVRRGGFIYRIVDRSKADLIVAVDKKPVRSLDDLLSHVESKKPGDVVTMTIRRENRQLDVPLKLEESDE
ncbi:MAG: S1C family serine protease [Gemmataceae bacterium]